MDIYLGELLYYGLGGVIPVAKTTVRSTWTTPPNMQACIIYLVASPWMLGEWGLGPPMFTYGRYSCVLIKGYTSVIGIQQKTKESLMVVINEL